MQAISNFQKRFFFRLALVVALFITSIAAVSYELIPYVYFLKRPVNAGGARVLPKYFLASNYEGPPSVDSTEKGEAQINKERRELIPGKLASRDFDGENVIILEKPSPISPQFGDGTVEVLTYGPQTAIFKTNSTAPKLLFVQDRYYFGWKATVDGEKREMLRANYAYRAIPLIKGVHTVRFYYDNKLFYAGSFLSLTILGILKWPILRRNRQAG